jgi:uncharacterized repeat protein (TIGR04138 family)
MDPQNGKFNANVIGFLSMASKSMENIIDFGIKAAHIIEKDKRYCVDAYTFIMSALNYTVAKLDEHRHISGKELLHGIREYAIKQYGPMTRTVLESWGIKGTTDFGEIVFNLVEAGIIKRRPEDTKVEFIDVYDFKTAFDKPYRRSLSPKLRAVSGKSN